MKWLNPEQKLYQRDDPVAPGSTAHERAATPLSPNTPPRTRMANPACQQTRRDFSITAQNRPKLSIFDHLNRTISSAQRYFSPDSPQNFFDLTTQPKNSLEPRPAVRRAPIAVEQHRTKPNKAEHHRTPDLQRSAPLPPKNPRKSPRPEHPEQAQGIYSEFSSCGVTMILQCSSGSPSVSKAPATPSSPTLPVTIGPG